jgi:hypothetical protein
MDDLHVTHAMGGMMEFEKTGIYPNKLRISSTKYDHVWRIKITEESQSGMLKIKRIPLYFYVYNDGGFTIREELDGEVQEDLLDYGMTEIHQD